MTIGGLKTAVEEARSISRDSLKLVYKQVHGRCMHGCLCAAPGLRVQQWLNRMNSLGPCQQKVYGDSDS